MSCQLQHVQFLYFEVQKPERILNGEWSLIRIHKLEANLPHELPAYHRNVVQEILLPVLPLVEVRAKRQRTLLGLEMVCLPAILLQTDLAIGIKLNAFVF